MKQMNEQRHLEIMMAVHEAMEVYGVTVDGRLNCRDLLQNGEKLTEYVGFHVGYPYIGEVELRSHERPYKLEVTRLTAQDARVLNLPFEYIVKRQYEEGTTYRAIGIDYVKIIKNMIKEQRNKK